jgi:hypothetical protein
MAGKAGITIAAPLLGEAKALINAKIQSPESSEMTPQTEKITSGLSA